MLFNSPEFIFLFLPLTLLLFFQIGERQHYRLALLGLTLASLCFYGSWNAVNLCLLLGSVLVNYWLGSRLLKASSHSAKQKTLGIGILANLIFLGYFKYAEFLVTTINDLWHSNLTVSSVILPLGISFFTFQQIAYLVDIYRGAIIESDRLLPYAAFVTLFPYVTSGPLVRRAEIIPQLTSQQTYRFKPENLATGITFFSLGLFKKMVFAESLAPYSDQIFAAAQTVPLTFVEAWIGALAFTLQLYFDFSGYSDMAIGVACMFGIQLPINFSSPYKAASITDFWRRWHITLSNFLRDYLYIPMGGSRRGEIRRYCNLILTMLIGGLWHGAGWSFIIWGGLHGVYLAINHAWRSFQQTVLQRDPSSSNRLSRLLGWLITFLAVVAAWVFFKAETLATASTVLQGMAGMNGLSLPHSFSTALAFLKDWGVQFHGWMPNITIQVEEIADVEELESHGNLMLGLLLFVWLMPNTQQWISSNGTAADATGNFLFNYKALWKKLQWQPNHFWAVVSALLTVAALLNLAKVSEFLYFEF